MLRIEFRFRGIRWLPTHTTLQNVISQRSSLLPSQQKLTTADTANLNSSDIFSAACFADMLPIKLIIRKWGQKVDAIAYLGFTSLQHRRVWSFYLTSFLIVRRAQTATASSHFLPSALCSSRGFGLPHRARFVQGTEEYCEVPSSSWLARIEVHRAEDDSILSSKLSRLGEP